MVADKRLKLAALFMPIVAAVFVSKYYLHAPASGDVWRTGGGG